jgi:hypothetical protein
LLHAAVRLASRLECFRASQTSLHRKAARGYASDARGLYSRIRRDVPRTNWWSSAR